MYLVWVCVPCSKLLHKSMPIVTTEAKRFNPFTTWHGKITRNESKNLKKLKTYSKVIYYYLLLLTYLVLFLRSFYMDAHIIAYRLRISLVITTKNIPLERLWQHISTSCYWISRNRVFQDGEVCKYLKFAIPKETRLLETQGGFHLCRNKQRLGEKSRGAIWIIRESGRTSFLAVDGQCDSPGHNATYNIATALDVKTNKVLDFKIVHVKVRSTSLVLLQP